MIPQMSHFGKILPFVTNRGQRSSVTVTLTKIMKYDDIYHAYTYMAIYCLNVPTRFLTDLVANKFMILYYIIQS